VAYQLASLLALKVIFAVSNLFLDLTYLGKYIRNRADSVIVTIDHY